MFSTRYLHSIIFLLLVLLSSCAVLQPSFESPTITVSAFRVVPSDSINPEFEIDLHVINPNGSALALRGLSYSAIIEGHKVLTGVANQLPIIAAYGEADVSLSASADLFSSFRLLADLMQKQRQGLKYQLNIKLDIGDFIPAIYIERKGEVALTASGH